ncbi:MAG TPA: hypothetical protein VM533_08225 [Fimbriiglobus sp.]|nr:hypothetical protein [Fimbriiglobus sp.]
MENPRVVAFRMSYWRWLLVGNVFTQVLYAAVFVLLEVVITGRRGLGDPGFWSIYVAKAVAVTMALVLSLVIYVTTWQVWVGPDTLCGSNAWGWFVTVSWGSVHAVRPFNLLTLPYLRVYSDETRRVIWLPLFLVDYARFAELVAEYAGADHPVTRAVWRRIEDS